MPEAPDADARTLHVRCGSDLFPLLRAAGFHGDFYEHSYPYLIGPVRDEGPGVIEERARFIFDAYGRGEVTCESILVRLERDEELLHASAGYERVVIWSEGDVYDQLVLVRLLGHYARHARPARLEMINQGDYPGIARFLGLGQLPPEALLKLWPARETAGAAQLELGLAAWLALASDDPRALAAIARTGTPALPLLAPALRRHLQELPATTTGLSLTEVMALTALEQGPFSLDRLFREVTDRDPLPGQGDFQFRDRVLGMEIESAPVLTRESGADAQGRTRPPWTDVLAITDLGRSALAGRVDFRSLSPPARWVGGVRVAQGCPDWRWDSSRGDVVLLAPGGERD